MVKKMYNDDLPDEEQKRASDEEEPSAGVDQTDVPKSSISKAPSMAASSRAASKVVSKPTSENGMNSAGGETAEAEGMTELSSLAAEMGAEKPHWEGDEEGVLSRIRNHALDSVFDQDAQMPFGMEQTSPLESASEGQDDMKGLHLDTNSKKVCMSSEIGAPSPSGFGKKSVRLVGATSFHHMSPVMVEDLLSVSHLCSLDVNLSSNVLRFHDLES
jgi:hypothetical protein